MPATGIIARIRAMLTDVQWLEVKKGAHVVVMDAGAFYQSVVANHLHKLRHRHSLHRSTQPQCEMEVMVHGRRGYLLIGAVKDWSWFQIEEASGRLKLDRSLVTHAKGAIKFGVGKLVGRAMNTGPHGESHFTEDRPIIVTSPPAHT